MLLIIMGKTNSGKDFVANYIREQYGVPILVSYATRPKRDYEINGVEHWFISKEEMSEIKEKEDLIAYTINEKTGIEYCATAQAMPAKTSIYILNPDGLYWGLKEGSLADIPYCTIYVDRDEKDILESGIKRGDNPVVLQQRLESERDEFDSFKHAKEYEYILYNSGTKENLLSKVDALCKELKLTHV